jgi:hypothetical protein
MKRSSYLVAKCTLLELLILIHLERLLVLGLLTLLNVWLLCVAPRGDSFARRVVAEFLARVVAA